MSKLAVIIKFKRGDIVTLKSMADHPEHGHPQRMEVRYFQVVSTDDNCVDISYWVRLLRHGSSGMWSLYEDQCFSTGPRLLTGEVQISGPELCFYVPPEGETESETEGGSDAERSPDAV